MHASIEARLAKIERRHRHRARGPHRYTDAELGSLISGWAVALFRRESLLP